MAQMVPAPAMERMQPETLMQSLLILIPEVLYALAEQAGIDRLQLEKLRATKAEERGSFANRIIWTGNHPSPPHR